MTLADWPKELLDRFMHAGWRVKPHRFGTGVFWPAWRMLILCHQDDTGARHWRRRQVPAHRDRPYREHAVPIEYVLSLLQWTEMAQ